MIYRMKNGFVKSFTSGKLKEWSGEIVRKRRGKIPFEKINISRYFNEFKGDCYIISSPDEGKTLIFKGSGPLLCNGEEVEPTPKRRNFDY